MISRFDVPKLKELLCNFHLLTGIRIVVFNDRLQEVAAWPEEHSPFCGLIRSDPVGSARCRDSDRDSCLWCKQHGSYHIYRCHAGLTETVAPIRHENLVIGYMMLGQLMPHGDPETLWGEVEQSCAEYHVDKQALRRAFLQQEYRDPDKLHASSQLMEACAAYLWLSRMTSLSEGSLPHRLDEYITGHLEEDLSADALCARFHISKSRLYKLSRHCYGMGIQEFIRTQRVQAAKELLETTALPIHQVAAQVGIANYNYFTKVFKAAADGMTPKDYRASRMGSSADG